MSDDHGGLDSDEPHTPTWFTFLGVGLFLLGGILALLTSTDEVPSDQMPAEPSAAAEAEVQPPAAAPAPAAAAAAHE